MLVFLLYQVFLSQKSTLLHWLIPSFRIICWVPNNILLKADVGLCSGWTNKMQLILTSSNTWLYYRNKTKKPNAVEAQGCPGHNLSTEMEYETQEEWSRDNESWLQEHTGVMQGICMEKHNLWTHRTRESVLHLRNQKKLNLASGKDTGK